jgi:hypothetical protein
MIEANKATTVYQRAVRKSELQCLEKKVNQKKQAMHIHGHSILCLVGMQTNKRAIERREEGVKWIHLGKERGGGSILLPR